MAPWPADQGKCDITGRKDQLEGAAPGTGLTPACAVMTWQTDRQQTGRWKHGMIKFQKVSF